jgi:hypothetical protein
MVFLHAANGFNSTACRFRRNGVTNEDDGAHSRKAERESTADAETE